MSIASASSGRRFRLNRLVWTKKRGEVGRNLGFSCLFFSLKGTPHPHLTLIRSSPAIEKKNYEIFPEKKERKETPGNGGSSGGGGGGGVAGCCLSGSVAFRFRCVPVPCETETPRWPSCLDRPTSLPARLTPGVPPPVRAQNALNWDRTRSFVFFFKRTKQIRLNSVPSFCRFCAFLTDPCLLLPSLNL